MSINISVYRNLNNGQLSIKDVKSGLVLGHCQRIRLKKVVFKVSQAGIERIRRERVKSVVAMVNGECAYLDGFVSYKDRHLDNPGTSYSDQVSLERPIFFNPYKNDGFVNEDMSIITKAEEVEISKNGKMFF